MAVSRVGERQPARKLMNPRINGHVHVHGLICHYCERLRHRADVPASAVLDIQNVLSRGQSDPIISIVVRCDARNLSLLVTAHDDKRVVGVIRRCHFGRCFVRKLDLLGRKDL